MARSRFVHPVSIPADIGGDSLTVQQFKEDCDIRCIIERHRRTGEPLPINPNGVFLDMLEQPEDLHSALELCRDVAAQMDRLPLAARERFGYDPVRFVEFLSDESNKDEAVRLGLLPPSPAPVDTSTSVVGASSPVSEVVTPSDT